MVKQCIALCKKLLLVCVLLAFVSCYTIKSSVIGYISEKYPSKYWHEQQRVKDSINKKEHKTVPLP
jgi:hypothetical protein